MMTQCLSLGAGRTRDTNSRGEAEGGARRQLTQIVLEIRPCGVRGRCRGHPQPTGEAGEAPRRVGAEQGTQGGTPCLPLCPLDAEPRSVLCAVWLHEGQLSVAPTTGVDADPTGQRAPSPTRPPHL